MTFSQRTHWDTEENPLAEALRRRRAAGLPLIDLTASNPTRCGFRYDSELLLGALRKEASLEYDPDPRGIRAAREAICGYYRDHNAEVDSERIFLTTSTSEAYSYLFRLLCDPGEEILIAQPSYPLFEYLADLEDVRLKPYPLFYDHGWHLDLHGLRQQITERTRAVAVVHPNNPTGHFTAGGERSALEQVCLEHGLSLIVDEVFLDYGLAGHSGRSFASGGHPALKFVVSGLSKIAALPQMKAAWIACCGPQELLGTALNRLEVIADTFLSMNAPVQWAMPEWLAGRASIQGQIRERLEMNLAALDRLLAKQSLLSRLDVEAGWYVVLRIPALAPDEEVVRQLVEEAGVSIHPGYFFGFSESGWLVASLLCPSDEFARGMEAVLKYCQQRM